MNNYERENMTEEKQGKWAIIELMGHNVIAGYVTEESGFGTALMRVDVPATSIYGAYTKLLGTGSIYAVTFVSEEVARTVAESRKQNPVQVYAPELVSVQEHNAIVEKMRQRIIQLQQPALNDGNEFESDEEEIEL